VMKDEETFRCLILEIDLVIPTYSLIIW